MKIKFTKSPTAVFKLAYFEGDVVDMPDKQAEMLIEAGYAVEHISDPDLEDIPNDFPGKAKIVQFGIKTMEELKKYAGAEDLTTIPGIGKGLAKQIIEKLK